MMRLTTHYTFLNYDISRPNDIAFSFSGYLTVFPTLSRFFLYSFLPPHTIVENSKPL